MRTATTRKRAAPASSPSEGTARATDAASSDEESLLRKKSHGSPAPGNKSPAPSTIAGRAKASFRGAALGGGRPGIVGLLQDLLVGIALGAVGTGLLLAAGAASGFIGGAPRGGSDAGIAPAGAYGAMVGELSDSRAVVRSERSAVDARTSEEASLRAELVALRPGYRRLLRESGLDEFCPDCQWGMGLSCQARVNYLLEKYSDTATRIECVSKLVVQGKTTGKCLKTTNEQE